ncbi:hypothetical protein NDU88_005121 [Pleurodeles waltl]|uniref:Uncharacterized protein n=1 Tax=Pleurodeles waltl TaxID=8319 RepID=A0AAV7MZJ4_PLEWA|nr:hypothetical protein NDU88_005121 [Pleurodeles waltl]
MISSYTLVLYLRSPAATGAAAGLEAWAIRAAQCGLYSQPAPASPLHQPSVLQASRHFNLTVDSAGEKLIFGRTDSSLGTLTQRPAFGPASFSGAHLPDFAGRPDFGACALALPDMESAPGPLQ